MRPLVAVLCAALTGCATSGSGPTQPPTVRAVCDQRANCFSQRAVRDFRVLDNSSMVVFVGSAGCPYLVEVDGIFCNLRGSAYLRFHDLDGRICGLGRSYISGNLFAGEDELCQVRSIEPLNDDEVVETYAAHGIVDPLPPAGSGELGVMGASGQGAPLPPATGEPADSETGAEWTL